MPSDMLSLPIDTDNDLWALLYQVYDLIVKARARELASVKLSLTESAVLCVLANTNGAVTPAEMSRRILRETNSTSTLLQRMEHKGLISKNKDLKHKHLIRLALTEKGRKTQKRTNKRNTIYRSMSALADDEKKQFRELLLKLRAAAAKQARIKHDIKYPCY